MIEFTDEVKEIAKEFHKTFGYGVPFAMIPPSVTTLALIHMLQQCIETKEDTLLSCAEISYKEGMFY